MRDKSDGNNETIVKHREHYDSKNIVAQYLIRSFKRTILSLIQSEQIETIFEAGCGDGHLALYLCESKYIVNGGDINPILIEYARKDAVEKGFHETAHFELLDIHTYDFTGVTADLLLCCEVLEHLSNPDEALKRMSRAQSNLFLFSVPDEPLWRLLNICRLQYLSDLGNTPGHINHWGYRGFKTLLEKHFTIKESCRSTPWIVTLCQKL